MACRPLRLLHASDLHLERTLHGLAEAPDHLRDMLLEAPLRAAARLVDAALAEGVDLVLLAGDVIAPALSGPRGLSFLVEQLGRLAERGVAVYWSTGKVDSAESWPADMALPGDVHLFPAGQTRQIIHHQNGEPLARIIGQGYQRGGRIAAGDLRPDPDGLFTIGLAYGRVTPELLKGQRIGYLALGGRHDRFSCSTGVHGAHYPGTPQGRCPAESGPHGCTIVHVDETGKSRTRFIATDVVRWIRERVVVQAPTTPADLEELLAARVESIRERSGPIDLLIRWRLGGAGLAGLAGPRETFARRLLENLRRRFGHASPVIWSESLNLEPPLARNFADEDSIAADLLQLVRQYEHDPARVLDLGALLPESERVRWPESATRITSPGEREEVLTQIARLGVELLGPTSPEASTTS